MKYQWLEYWHNWFPVLIIINEKKQVLSPCKAFTNNSFVNFNSFQDEGGEQKVPHPLLSSTITIVSPVIS